MGETALDDFGLVLVNPDFTGSRSTWLFRQRDFIEIPLARTDLIGDILFTMETLSPSYPFDVRGICFLLKRLKWPSVRLSAMSNSLLTLTYQTAIEAAMFRRLGSASKEDTNWLISQHYAHDVLMLVGGAMKWEGPLPEIRNGVDCRGIMKEDVLMWTGEEDQEVVMGEVEEATAAALKEIEPFMRTDGGIGIRNPALRSKMEDEMMDAGKFARKMEILLIDRILHSYPFAGTPLIHLSYT